MLQIRNADDGKSEWNVSEAHIIIPMIDGDLISSKESDKILTSTLTLNSLENGDQTVLTNALEHNLVVGLDKNLFETTNYKSDLLIIQNPDLKLLPCNSDLKVAYTLSNVDQDKGEIFWQNPILKDKICASDKAIFEVRHVLNYDDIDLEKANAQINLENVANGITSLVTKTGKEVLTEEAISPDKNATNSEFIVNYSSEVDNSKSICILLNTEASKAVENVKSLESKKLHQRETHSEFNVGPYKIREDFDDSVFNVNNHTVSYSNSLPIGTIKYGNNKTDKKEKIMTKKNLLIKESKVEGREWDDETSDSFPEKNLPLKKKAKMKRTLVTGLSENQKSLPKQNLITAHELVKHMRKKDRPVSAKLQKKQDPDNSDSEPLISLTKVQREVKHNSLHEDSLVKEAKDDFQKTVSLGGDKMPVTKFKSIEFDETKFSNIQDLVEYLRKCRIINISVWQTLISGLKEIKVDILKEMNARRKENFLPKSFHYSPQLKAFALVLYFKQRAAFNHLSQVYRNGWPSLGVIKEWKRKMNSHRKRNFARIHSDTENSKS